MQPAVEQTFGPFVIERVLGEGGTSVVYAATRDGEALALKVLRSDIDITASEKKRFLTEAELLRRLTHPNVIHVIDAGELPDGRPYLALPLLHGETLAARIARGHIANALELFYAAADAVSALHGAGLLHRDIKPENFFLEDERIVLLDFGIARDPDASASTSTREGQVRGTPAYMAPERFFGAAATPASEVYELAATLHAMLAGTLPWTNGTDLDQRLDPKLSNAIEPSLQQVLRGALAVRAEVRPQTVSAFVKALRERVDTGSNPTREMPHAAAAQRSMTDLGTAATTMAPATTTRKLRRRTKFGLASALLILAAGGATFGLVHKAGEHYVAQLVAPRRVVVVLKPRNVSGDPSADWMATAIAEQLRVGLAASDALVVPAPRTDDVSPETAKLHGAQIVVTGSYHAEADHTLRLSMNAYDTASGVAIGSSNRIATIETMSSAMTKIIDELRSSLGAAPSSAEHDKALVDSLPMGGEASHEYAEGLACARRFAPACAKDHAERAVALAPNSALAHESLAEAQHAIGNEAAAKLEAARALELGHGAPEAQHLSLEAHAAHYAADWPKAISAYEQLVAKTPDDLRASLGLADAQSNSGDAKAAFATLAAARTHSKDPRLDLLEARISDKANDFVREIAAANRCMLAADELGERELGAYCRLAAGWASVTLGKLDDAKLTLDEALRQFGAEGDRNGTAHAMLDLGTLLEQKGEFKAAQKIYEDALRLARELGNQQVIATTLMDLGQVLSESSDPTSARARYEEALTIARTLSDPNLVEETLLNLGSIASKSGDLAAAQKAYDEALALGKQHAHHRVICAVLVNTSNLQDHAGHVDQAVETAKQAVAEARLTTEPLLLTSALSALAMHEGQAGHTDDALSRFDEIEQLQRNASDKVGLINTGVTRVGVLSDANRDAEAAKAAHALLAQIDKASDPDNYGWLNLFLAKNELEEKHFEAADALLVKAETVLINAGDGDLTGEVHMTRAELLAAKGNLTKSYALIASTRAEAVKGGADALVIETDIVAAAMAWKYEHDPAAREKLGVLAAEARAKGSGTAAKMAEDLAKTPGER
ncbi:MAG: tetratricopeptide repeat protein [Kofleriaceae bacterium]